LVSLVEVPIVSAQVDSAGDSGAAERIRQQLARELHDQVAQTLTTMLVELEEFKDQQAGRQSVLREVDVLQGSTREVLQNIRQLLYDLRGEPRFDEDFPESIRTGLLRSFQERTGIAMKLTVSPAWPNSISAPASLNLYRIIQEALSNVRRHSGARQVEVVLSVEGADRLVVTVCDDGRGTPGLDDASQRGLGLLGIRERVVVLGGELHVHSEAGVGTTITASFPREQVL
jgi:signal transduction histidine kinase